MKSRFLFLPALLAILLCFSCEKPVTGPEAVKAAERKSVDRVEIALLGPPGVPLDGRLVLFLLLIVAKEKL